ncbi:hypothetical protein [Mucilaginibacter sp.]|uniref:hypothetical protein n=1 Tax=Mucilaginibacter sp. TaxID=1882438 RepID=UPI000CA9DEFC|nr:hypothetical protein [Mucilaginibacter sp.]PLW89665.1 MAG: hypothetical protein C0154_10315 [Mucilaginibacter sp.]PMP65161.1 MAG: hypothetical protein C0191_04285 [Mucilaginibacter sp.]HEK21161.1 hypothetical protein [Bacteroidota bacterium]
MNRFGFWCLVMVLMASACSRSTTVGCPANQICTEIFTSVGTRFVDRNGNNVAVTDFKVFNQRTHKKIEPRGVLSGGSGFKNYTIVTDANRKDLSTGGDDIKVTAIYGNRKVEAFFKISGGCNCHVERLAGPEKIIL